MEIVSSKNLSIKNIFKSSAWTTFYQKYFNRIRSTVFENLSKIFDCGTEKLGYASYQCDCGHQKKVCFTCKSRFCSSCGKIASDNWMNNVISWAPNVKYRHIVLTIPSELRTFFLLFRKPGLDILFKASSQTFLSLFAKKFKSKPGIITVLHTFGSDVKWNPHIHCIVTNGGLSLNLSSWIANSFIPYSLLNKTWKYFVITNLRKFAKKNLSQTRFVRFNKLLSSLYQKNWYVNVGKNLENLTFTVKYVGRYAKRPVLAETSLNDFDGKHVSFSFKDKKNNTSSSISLPVHTFFSRLIRHIPDKYYRMIRYSGIFANKTKNKFLLVIQNIFENQQRFFNTVFKQKFNWRKRIIQLTGDDPLKCPVCSNLMKLVLLVFRSKNNCLINFSP